MVGQAYDLMVVLPRNGIAKTLDLFENSLQAKTNRSTLTETQIEALMPLTTKILGIIVAATLLVFGIPKLISETWLIVGEATMQKIARGERPSTEEIEIAIETRKAALAIGPDAGASADLALLYVINGITAESATLAIAELEKSLEAEPISAHSWLLLSNILVNIPAKRAEAVQAWRNSRALSEFDRLMWLERIAVGVPMYSDFTEEDRTALKADMEMAYRSNRGGFRSYMKARNMLEWAKFLLDDPEKTEFLSR